MDLNISRSNPENPEESFFPSAMDGLSHDEAGRILSELGQIGGIHDTHSLIEAAGITRNLDTAAARWNKAIESFPIIVDRTVSNGVSSIKESQSQHQNNIAILVKDIQCDIKSSITKWTEKFEQSLAAHDVQLKKTRSFRSSSTALTTIDLKLLTGLTIGAVSATMLILPISLFVLVPHLVRLENGSDWALKKYYNSPEGRQAREEFKIRCKGVYPCKKLKK